MAQNADEQKRKQEQLDMQRRLACAAPRMLPLRALPFLTLVDPCRLGPAKHAAALDTGAQKLAADPKISEAEMERSSRADTTASYRQSMANRAADASSAANERAYGYG